MGQLQDEVCEVCEGMEGLRAYSRMHQRLVAVLLGRVRKRNLVGLVRTDRGVDKDGEVVNWEEDLEEGEIHEMGKKFKKQVMPEF